MTDLRKVFDDLVRFETLLWNRVDRRLQHDCGTTLATVNLMLIVDQVPRCRVQDIARALALTVGGVSQAVDRLERSGLATRRANPDDRRSSVIELTSDGDALLRDAGPVFDDELERLIGLPLASSALEDLARSLDALRAAAAS